MTLQRKKGYHSMRALRIAGWANIALAAGHVPAWTTFGWVGIEPQMRELAQQGAALPYVLTVITAGFFLVFGLYALSGAGDLRRLPLLRSVVVLIAVIYLLRATLVGGIADVLAGDVKQSVFAAIALLIGLCYASGAVALRRRHGKKAAKRVDLQSAQPDAGV